MDLIRFLHTNGYAPLRKEWITAAIGAAAGIGSALWGASQSANAEQEARKKEAESHSKQMAYFQRKANESYADTAAGRNMIRQANDYADKNWKKAQGAAAVGGGTDAATAMAKEQGNKVISDTLSNMAAQDTARKDSAEKGMMQQEANYSAQQAAHTRQQGANTAALASAIGNTAASLGSSLSSTTPSNAPVNAPANSNTAANLRQGAQDTGLSAASNASGLANSNIPSVGSAPKVNVAPVINEVNENEKRLRMLNNTVKA